MPVDMLQSAARALGRILGDIILSASFISRALLPFHARKEARRFRPARFVSAPIGYARHAQDDIASLLKTADNAGGVMRAWYGIIVGDISQVQGRKRGTGPPRRAKLPHSVIGTAYRKTF